MPANGKAETLTEANEKQTAAELLDALEACYAEYLERDPDAGKGFAQLLSGWFRPPGAGETTAEDEAFVADVDRLVAALSLVLAECDAQTGDEVARRALTRMIRPPETHSSSQRLYFCAMQEKGTLLTPFLKPESRADLCRLMRQAESPRRQLPSQRRLFEALGGK